MKAEYFLCAALQKNNGANIKRSPGKMLGIVYRISHCLEEEKHKVLDWKKNECLAVRSFVLGKVCCLSTRTRNMIGMVKHGEKRIIIRSILLTVGMV